MTSGIWVLVPAAGTGSRMGADRPKQYLSLAGSTVLSHTLSRLLNCPDITGVMLGLSADDAYWPACESELRSNSKFKGTYLGGQTRAETVLRGCKALLKIGNASDWVLVHDAARPCIRTSDVQNLIKTILQNNAEGGLLGLPINDTVKRANSEQLVVETVSRTGLWRAQTPQMFRLSQLHEALSSVENQGHEVTDEAQAMAHIGIQALMVAGSEDNIKITHPQDLELAASYLEQQKRES